MQTLVMIIAVTLLAYLVGYTMGFKAMDDRISKKLIKYYDSKFETDEWRN